MRSTDHDPIAVATLSDTDLDTVAGGTHHQRQSWRDSMIAGPLVNQVAAEDSSK
jgi:hypothetical protein